ncbi:YheC/YheD family protein [Bacillus dakarensis]|uniref:YheC/YheD family endospore coat-associated protein n=1 Tax=Robertmurraya dakarensis TaxID=1926278 RepID=UPI00098157D5|nr:YheC/YheD family protein [Bacillus dakarensis]
MTVSSYIPITIVPVKTFQNHDNLIYLNPSFINYWGINHKELLRLRIGVKTMSFEVVLSTKVQKNEIHVSESILSKFPLPIKRMRFLCQYDLQQKTLQIGPIIAMVTEIDDKKGNPNFRSVHSFCEELHHLSETIGGFFYIFHIGNFSESEIQGYYYLDGDWQKGMCVPPDIIYNRVHSRRVESSSTVQKILARINQLQIPFFNDGFLSKWDVYEILQAEEHLHPYLPKTSLFSAEKLTAYLEKYQSVFIKPVNGSKGRNIISVKKNQNGLTAQSTSHHLDDILEFSTDAQFSEWFQKQIKKTSYLIQQSIPLASYKNRPLDFRILCHRNHQNNWSITSTVARVSGEKQFVSNLARGGEMMKPSIPLADLFGRKLAFQQIALMKELALETAYIVSQSSSGLIGELGIDIGIDEDGELWIIEVNSKPSKDAEKQASNIRPSAKAIFEYSSSLSFNHKRNKGDSK